MTFSRRSILALIGGLFSANAIGCSGGGSGDGDDTSNGDNDTNNNTANAGVGEVTARTYAEISVPDGNDLQAPRVELRWQTTAETAVSSIVNFLIFRDGVLIDALAAQANTYTDSPDSGVTFGYSIPENRTLPIPFAGEAVENPNGSDRNLIDVLNVPRTPLMIGVPHRYAIAIVYREQSGGSARYRLSSVVATGGSATPTLRPYINGAPTFGRASRTSSYASTSINFNMVAGANQYVLEFADNPAFTGKQSSPPFEAAGGNGAIGTAPTVNLTQLFPNLQERDGIRMHFRIGARNSGDTPGPIARDIPNGGEFVYAIEENSFEIFTAAPPATG